MAAENITLEADLASAERGICSFLDRLDEQLPNPLAKRLSPQERGAELETLVRKLGHRYVWATLGNFEVYDEKAQRPVLDCLKAFARNMPERIAGGAGLILFGPTGCGKDHLLAALLKIAVAKHGFTAHWCDGVKLFAESRYAIGEDNEHALLRKLTTPQILALSDPVPPTGALTQFQACLLRDMVDQRYRAGLSTWLLTNLDQREAAEAALTGPLLSRLRHNSLQLLCDWGSYRDRTTTLPASDEA